MRSSEARPEPPRRCTFPARARATRRRPPARLAPPPARSPEQLVNGSYEHYYHHAHATLRTGPIYTVRLGTEAGSPGAQSVINPHPALPLPPPPPLSPSLQGFFFKLWDRLAGSVPPAGKPCVCSRCEEAAGRRSQRLFDALEKPDYSPLLSPAFWAEGLGALMGSDGAAAAAAAAPAAPARRKVE